jgi:hypothetical protein
VVSSEPSGNSFPVFLRKFACFFLDPDKNQSRNREDDTKKESNYYRARIKA